MYSVRQEFNRLYDRVAATCARGEEVEEDLMAYREQQKVKIHEIQVSRANLIGNFRGDLNDCTRNSWEIT